MSKYTVGKLLPNIRVSIDPNRTETISSNVVHSSIDTKTDFVRPNVEPFKNPKVYKSKSGGFATGIDLLSEENIEMLNKRAERFGIPIDESKETIKALYDSLGITHANKTAGKLKHIRLNTLHIRGVEELSTDGTLSYFKDYGPLLIEWINDYSCNVIFNDDATAARALLGLSTPFSSSFYAKVKSSENSKSISKGHEKKDEKMDTAQVVNIPVPPGEWRLGKNHPRAKTVLLRYATTGDKKVAGAESRSVYYKKYGNPNYQGLTGLISKSRKQRHAAANKWVSRSYTSKMHSNAKTASFIPANERQVVVSEIKPVETDKKRIKSEPSKTCSMYADEEEAKARELRFKSIAKSVHSRLGKKYTSDELRSMGSLRESTSSTNEAASTANLSRNANSDLRLKLRKLRKDKSRKPYEREYLKYDDKEDYTHSYRSDEGYKGSASKKYRRVDQIKNESRSSSYKRKYRSPMYDYDDEDYSHSYRSDEGYKGSASKKNSRVEELKKESRSSYYKRKHRSPLYDDDDSEASDSSII